MALSTTFIDVGLILAAIALLAGGAWLVVEAGTTLAKRWGVSPMWVGLVVVSFGTTMPELTVSTIASAQGVGGLAMGNVVGSNILNILIVLGATAAIQAVPSNRVTIRRNILLVIVASIGVWLLAADGVLHRGEGALLLLLVPLYLMHIYREEKRGWVPVPEPPQGLGLKAPVLSWIALVAGIGVLVVGGAAMVEGATGVAETLGVPPRIAGLTIVAIGTSLPELSTSLVAAYRGKVELAIGNVIGANLLNILWVLGIASMVRPIPVSAALWWVDMVFMILVAGLLLRVTTTKRTISRVEGALMVGLYLGYVGYLVGFAVGT